MAKTITVPGGVATLVESKADCPYCKRRITFDEIEAKWTKSPNSHMRMKCKCRRFITIAQNIMGDFVAY